MTKDHLRKILTCLLLLSCIAYFSSCGYFLYPERRGQKQGEIDAPVLIMDCAALLLCIIPGVIAIAVDFTSGAIYLPGRGRGHALKVIPFQNGRALNKAHLESLIAEHTGQDVYLDRDSVMQLETKDMSQHEIEETLTYLNQHIDDRALLSQFAGTRQNS